MKRWIWKDTLNFKIGDIVHHTILDFKAKVIDAAIEGGEGGRPYVEVEYITAFEAGKPGNFGSYYSDRFVLVTPKRNHLPDWL